MTIGDVSGLQVVVHEFEVVCLDIATQFCQELVDVFDRQLVLDLPDESVEELVVYRTINCGVQLLAQLGGDLNALGGELRLFQEIIGQELC